MRVAAPPLSPLFRSPQQMQILADVFYGEPAPGHEIARRTGIPQPTVSRELARLEAAGLIIQTRVGSARIPSPAPDLPYAEPLRQLLAYAGGIIPALKAAYEHDERVDEVFIFGSWARRYHGEQGPPPNDIDVAIVSSTLTRLDVAETRADVESSTGTSLDQFVLHPASERLAELRLGSVSVFRRPS